MNRRTYVTLALLAAAHLHAPAAYTAERAPRGGVVGAIVRRATARIGGRAQTRRALAAETEGPQVGAIHDPRTGQTTFRVWTDREDIKLHVVHPDGTQETHDLAHEPGDYRSVRLAAPPGTRYGYMLDGPNPLPDPATRSQPDGPDGLSAVVKPLVYVNRNPRWRGLTLEDLHRGNGVYELHVGTFTAEGTFDAIVPRLRYIKSLGVKAIQLMPVNDFPGERNWGYDTSNLAVTARYGGREGLRRLAEAAHRAGLGVIVDVQYNHNGPESNYLSQFHAGYKGAATEWGDSFDYDAAPVREHFAQNAEMLVRECGVDAIRGDAWQKLRGMAPARPDVKTLIARRMHLAGKLVGQKTLVIPEHDENDPNLVRAESEGGIGVDAQLSQDARHAVHTWFAERSTGNPPRAGYYRNYPPSSGLVAKGIAHKWTREGDPLPAPGPRGQPAVGVRYDQLISPAPTDHDQTGNDALGRRPIEYLAPAAYRAYSALLMLLPHTTMIHMGEEYGETNRWMYFTNHQQAWLGDAVIQGRTHEFPESGFAPEQIPNPQATETFAKSKLDWSTLARPYNARLLNRTRAIGKLRAQHPAMRNVADDSVTARPLGPNAVEYTRRSEDGRKQLVVLTSRGGEALEYTPTEGRRWRVRFSSESQAHGGADTGRSPRDRVQFRDGKVRIDGPATVVLESV
jgi:maltooligosyltrehalose trehalohydrolase